jgi:hypothetical protein
MQLSDPTSTATSVAGNNSAWITLVDYCLKNPFLVLWNVALILGGIITFSHFVSIKYFPDLDVKTASSFLLGIALLGVSLMSVLAIVFVVPSYLIRNEIWRPYYLHHPAATGQEAVQVSDDIEKKRWFPFIALSFFHGLTAFFFWIFCASFLIENSHAHYRNIALIVSAVGFTLSILAMLGLNYSWKRKDVRDGLSTDGRLGHGKPAQHLTFVFIWVVIYPGYLILLAMSARKLDQNDIAGHLCVLAFAVAFIIVNTGLAITNFSSARSYLKIPAMAALLTVGYLSIPSNPLTITRAVFTTLAIGDLGSSQFVVKRPTCDAVNLIAPGACEVASESAGCIRPQSLANRIGAEYLLVLKVQMHTRGKIGPQMNQSAMSTEMKVPIPKSEVLVWGTVDADNVYWAACSTATKGHSQADSQNTGDS